MNDTTVRIGVLLPSFKSYSSQEHDFSYYNQFEKVLPAIVIAAEKYIKSISSNEAWKYQILVGDTQCSSTLGPLRAFNQYCSAG